MEAFLCRARDWREAETAKAGKAEKEEAVKA
jgi:hypothetical protein